MPLVLAQPDVRVLLRVALLVPFHLLPQDRREERVVDPVHPANDASRRRALLAAEQLVHRVSLLLRVPLRPDLRPVLSNRRDQKVPGPLRDLVRLEHRRDVQALGRLHRVRVRPQPVEDEQRPVHAPNLGVGRRVEARQTVRPDLVVQQPLDRVPDRLLHLAVAADAQGPFPALQQQRLGEAVRLGRPPATVGRPVANWQAIVGRLVPEEPERLR